MNKKKILLATGLIIIFSISIGFDLFLLKETPKQNNDKNKTNINKPISRDESVNQKITTNPHISVLETEFFTKLSDCKKANSGKDFVNQLVNVIFNKEHKNEDSETTLSDWEKDSLEKAETRKITPPIQINFPGAEILVIDFLIGGGFYDSFPFVRLGNSYCVLNDDNLKKVFAPIKNKEDALKYYLFLEKNFGTSLNQSQIYIKKQGDYEEAFFEGADCYDAHKEELRNKITETKKVEDGYLITLVGFNYIEQAEFYELEVKIKFDGTIEKMSKKTLFDCGIGAEF